MKLSWRTILLWTLPALVVGFFLWQGTFANRAANVGSNTANTRMTYGRFLEYLDADRIQSVDLYDGGRTAIVQVRDPDVDRIDFPIARC
jgi:cell division protease FtsH